VQNDRRQGGEQYSCRNRSPAEMIPVCP
jgi:hypothetical protein